MRNIAIILAGGTGSRFGDALPKQFLVAAGKTIIEHSISAFERSAVIDEIAVVVHPLYIARVEGMRTANSWQKVQKIVCGGSQRCDSSMAALRAYDGAAECNMLFHDAARPLVSQRIISDAAAALQHYNAVCAAIPAVDTIVEADSSGSVVHSIPSRNLLYCAQTPQGFRFSTIKEAYRRALQDADFIATDDCGIVRKYLPREPIRIVRGEACNMKLTYKEDIFIAEKLLSLSLHN